MFSVDVVNNDSLRYAGQIKSNGKDYCGAYENQSYLGYRYSSLVYLQHAPEYSNAISNHQNFVQWHPKIK